MSYLFSPSPIFQQDNMRRFGDACCAVGMDSAGIVTVVPECEKIESGSGNNLVPEKKF